MSQTPQSRLEKYLTELRTQLHPQDFQDLDTALYVTAQSLAVPYLAGKAIQPATQTLQVGEAYWLFRSADSPKRIREGLETLRSVAEAPSELELTLLDPPIPKELVKLKNYDHLGNEAYTSKLRYLRGRLAGNTNKRVAETLTKMADCLHDWIRNGAEDAAPFDLDIDAYWMGSEVFHKAGDKFITKT